ncbi:sugar phosphate isomerase/epimerase family protein [Amycolatopsis pigmentata]|uniref:Sugar phosphate isomerase/epimerase family protein n=1 Tax=Amycolatopsis pigmentata TaxID=450801 RepID=A0ABW5G958_9PSEU
MSTLSASSYCMREHLGPVTLDFTAPDGTPIYHELPYAKLLNLSEFPRRAKEELGVGAVETVAVQFSGIDDPEIDRFGAGLLAAGVELLNVAIDAGDLLEPDEEKRAAHVAEIRAWIARFTAMDARFVRVNPGSPFGDHAGGAPPAYLVEALVDLGLYARERGARLLVENHGGPSSDPGWMLALLDAVGEEHLGLLLDLGNFDALMLPMFAMLFSGGPIEFDGLYDGVDMTSVYAGIEALAGRAELVHVKAHEVGEDGGIGVVDLPRALGILAAHGYDGPLTVEYEGQGGDPWEKVRHILDVTRRYAPQGTVQEGQHA